jgi:hypothetical protein
LERGLTGGDYSIKVELDDDLMDVEARLAALKEAIEKNRDEEKFVTKYVRFNKQLMASIESLKKLLQSKHNSEVIEAVRVILQFKRLNIEHCNQYVKLTLVIA